MPEFWTDIPGNVTSEADVELRLVLPLLAALGYKTEDVAPKYPIVFREGRIGRKPEADFVCFNGPLRNRDTSLLVVEAKEPGEALPNGKTQGESYAANLRAPLLLLTNGQLLEVWQLNSTQESERVFYANVSSLAARRGELEPLLAKAAVVDYCRRFHVKTILTASSDFGRYETAELSRTAEYAASVPRTLRRLAADESEALHSDRLLTECPTGAVIVAPSGYGKTTLSKRLLRHAIEQRWRDGSKRLPFDVPVPDIEQTQLGILEFMQQRVCAHQPGLTLASLTEGVRTSGAIVFLDGFDRASSTYQRRLGTEITNLNRDYPRLQIFVFSRAAARPAASLPLFTLELLSEVEKRELEKVVLDHGQATAVSVIGAMSPTLSALCANPLLLRLSLDYWKREGAFPRQLIPLFRSWLETVLNHDGYQAVASITRERALTVIASATREGSVSGADVLRLLADNGLPAPILDELIRCDAVRLSGAAVEVQHEALADYLRARQITEASESDLLAQFPALPMPEDSFFPVLLMAHLPTLRLQSALWKRLTEAGPSIYFDALRYRFDVSAELSALDPDKLSEQYLTELLDGLEQPLGTFFAPLRETVVETLTGELGSELAVTGRLNHQSGSLTYRLHVLASANAARVTIGVPPLLGIIRGVNINKSGYRLDSARLISINLSKNSVLKAIERQGLNGGPLWAEERLIARCRFLAKEYDFPFVQGLSLDRIEKLLLPVADKWISSGPLSNNEHFAIQSLLDDVEVLRKNGKNSLDSWWHRLGWNDKEPYQDDEVIRRVLDEQYRRIQLVYSEVVKSTFSGISHGFIWLAQFPIRWKLTVLRQEASGIGSTVYFRWTPVASWSEAGADVTFGDNPPAPVASDVTSAELAALGRPNERFSRYAGFMPLSDFTGRQWNHHFDGATPVMHEVCSLLKDELEHVFSAMPARDVI
jgi:hypothetical protein